MERDAEQLAVPDCPSLLSTHGVRESEKRFRMGVDDNTSMYELSAQPYIDKNRYLQMICLRSSSAVSKAVASLSVIIDKLPANIRRA